MISRENTINFEIFKEEYITYNYNKLDQFYQKNIGFDNIDERLFLVEKSLQTVTKILPFTPLPKTHPYSIDNNLYSNSTGIPRKSFLKNLNFDTAANNDFSLHSTLSDLVHCYYL